MSDVLMLYLFTRLDIFVVGAAIVGMMLGVGILFLAVCIDDAKTFGETAKASSMRRMQVRLLWASVIPMLVFIALPSKSDMAIIVGGKIALDASRTDTAKEVGQEVLNAIRAQLEKATQ